MKNLKSKLTFVLTIIMLIFQSILFADNECPMSEWYPNMSISPNFTGGYYKPHRTDSAESQELPLTASMKVIIVFVQFPDEDPLTNNSEWPIGQPPTYMNNLLSIVRKNTGTFWNRYDETSERLSDYYQEVSRGQFHMTGITRHYIFDHNRSWYLNNTTTMNNEVYAKLQEDTVIQWPNYDKWQYLSAGNFRYQGDGNLDMLMMVRRTNSGDAGFAELDGSNFEIDPINHIWIRTGFSQFGSGTVQQGNLGTPPQPHPYNRFFGILIHEYGHYLFGPHSSVGLMTSRGGNSINDLYYSPFEKIKLGYLNTQLVNYYNNSSYSIRDISSRTSNDNILKVPISSNEYFLIENRRKISKYDVKMIGDTAQTNMFRNTLEYGKGVYIYHHRSTDLNYPGDQDEECADGLWNWTLTGATTPDWSNDQQVPVLKRTSIPTILNNDNGYWETLNNNKDGISAVSVYFSLGKLHESIGLCGTDKIYTNTPGYWTSRELWGDRLDSWNIGYNQVFSPYSNPNTKKWNDDTSGIFIYYESLTNGIASLKIYKTGQGFTENEILAFTPPSRPMGLKVLDCDSLPTINGYKRIKIRWNHNMEPDMENLVQGNQSYTKEYKIYRSTGDDMNSIPNDAMYFPEQFYECIDTVFIDETAIAEYIDMELISVCNKGVCTPPNFCTLYPVRYRVQAVDKYNSLSVLSDFAKTEAWSLNADEGADNFQSSSTIENNSIPTEYSLKQNYPNPFNPTTNIQYDLPTDNFVTIKIYDILGKEIVTLVNEFKNAGSYIVSFNASNLSSGIYYYKLKSGDVEMIRKMVVIK